MSTKDGTIIKSRPELGLEGLRFQGFMRDFPKHFHDYYVIGFIERGRRRLFAGGRERLLKEGEAVVFNPQDDHGCRAADGRPLHYLGLHIEARTLEKLAGRLFGREFRPRFTALPSALALEVKYFHDFFMAEEQTRAVETAFEEFLKKILTRAVPGNEDIIGGQQGLEAARTVMERKFAEPLSLERLSSVAGMSKYHFLRAFSRRTGLSPHSYLLALRVARARELLAEGWTLSEAALQTGFVDQSHFSNRFKTITGLTPDSYRRSREFGSRPGRPGEISPGEQGFIE